MSSTVDAQRLVAMSLGKIHASRGQRGGINLHKNLLVAGVLQKARSFCIIDGYSSPVSPPTSPTHETEEEAVEEGDQEVPSVEFNDDSAQLLDLDKENSAPDENDKSSRVDCSSAAHRDTLAESRSDNTESSGCQRCGKRRMTEVESAVDSISPAPKKFRSESQDYSSSCFDRAMDASPQISHLVHSFTGLLNGESNSDCSSDSMDELVDSSIHSCSTQIKEAFDTLSRPILAMTV